MGGRRARRQLTHDAEQRADAAPQQCDHRCLARERSACGGRGRPSAVNRSASCAYCARRDAGMSSKARSPALASRIMSTTRSNIVQSASASRLSCRSPASRAARPRAASMAASVPGAAGPVAACSVSARHAASAGGASEDDAAIQRRSVIVSGSCESTSRSAPVNGLRTSARRSHGQSASSRRRRTSSVSASRAKRR